jgi:Fic family protein
MFKTFETIHPFLDGNGRLGRLLITFMLCASAAFREPILYLSLYLKTHRETYYELLTGVRSNRRLGNVARILLDGGEGDVGPSGKFRTSDLGLNRCGSPKD